MNHAMADPFTLYITRHTAGLNRSRGEQSAADAREHRTSHRDHKLKGQVCRNDAIVDQTPDSSLPLPASYGSLLNPNPIEPLSRRRVSISEALERPIAQDARQRIPAPVREQVL